MKKIILTLAIVITTYYSNAQSFFTPSSYANSPLGVGANSIFGWGENFDRTIDVRPNPHPTYGTMMINYHTGLTFSAHSVYGGIRFYNQGYPNPYDPATGATMVMSIVNGRVGIGTTSPTVPLDVTGQGTGAEPVLLTLRGAGSAPYGLQLGANSTGAYGYIQSQQLTVSYTNTPLAIQPNGGNVGIGTTDTKGYKLAVNGSAIATSITVKEYANWPDYVFKPTYHLPKLSEVKSYIDQNQHLPDMPSEKEVKDNGINLGEMNKLLTKKVEELTLYAIEQQKQIEHLKEEQQKTAQQETRIAALEKALLKLPEANKQ